MDHQGRKISSSKIAKLHNAALKGDWIAALELFIEIPNLIKTPITEGGDIALHIAAVEGHEIFVSKLIEILEKDDVAAQNVKGCTALCSAAAVGHIKIAQIMLEKYPKLANIKGESGFWPLYMAAEKGFSEMAEFLYPYSNIGLWSPLEKVNLLTSAIGLEIYDLAIKILREDKTLAVAEDGNGETVLHLLAKKQLVFSHEAQGFWIKNGCRRSSSRMMELHKSALEGDWIAAQRLFEVPCWIKTPITEGGEIAPNIAADERRDIFISKFLEIMEKDDVAVQNVKGCTALCSAAAVGNIKIAQIMLEKCPNLANIKGENCVWPLYMAAWYKFGEMAEFLYPYSNIGSWTPLEKVNLLTLAINLEKYGLAMKILSEDKTLAIAENGYGETPLQLLAKKPLAFSHDGQGFCIKNVLSCMKKSKSHKMSTKCDAYALMDCLWEAVDSCQEDTESAVDSSQLFFIAEKSRNEDFLVELLKRDYNLLYKVNVFHVAVSNRFVKVYNLMYELGGTKDLLATNIDDEGNNILHLAGKLAPPKQLDSIPGAAMQLQREVLWFKVVEKLVRPSFRNMKNSRGETPHELFVYEHKYLMEKGEKFMRATAEFGVLISMYTVFVVYMFLIFGPDNNWMPSKVVAMFSLFASALMFMKILMSRFSTEDFLYKLPLCLVAGLSAFFFSFVPITVAAFDWFKFIKFGWAIALLCVIFFIGLPTILLMSVNSDLLVSILPRTYQCMRLFRSYNPLRF